MNRFLPQSREDIDFIDEQLQDLEKEVHFRLYSLKEGANYFGSHAANGIVFPFEGVAPFAGIFFLRNDSVLMRVASSAMISHDQKPVDNIIIYQNEKPLVLTHGELRFRIVNVDGRYAVSFMTITS